MTHDRKITSLAKSLYQIRADLTFRLTDEDALPDSVSNKLWHVVDQMQKVIEELETRYNCREEGQIDLGIGRDVRSDH